MAPKVLLPWVQDFNENVEEIADERRWFRRSFLKFLKFFTYIFQNTQLQCFDALRISFKLSPIRNGRNMAAGAELFSVSAYSVERFWWKRSSWHQPREQISNAKIMQLQVSITCTRSVRPKQIPFTPARPTLLSIHHLILSLSFD
jgi:hypothetical protein